MSILCHGNILEQSVTNVILMVSAVSPELWSQMKSEMWRLMGCLVTTGLMVTTLLHPGRNHSWSSRVEAVEEESGAVLMTPGPSSSLPSSSPRLPNHHPLSRLFVWRTRHCESEMRDIKTLIGPNRFPMPSYWLIITSY